MRDATDSFTRSNSVSQGVRWVAVAVATLMLAGCTGAPPLPKVYSCGEPAQPPGPALGVLPGFRGPPEAMARRFAEALGEELGAFGDAPRGTYAGKGWHVGDGFVEVYNETAPDNVRGMVRFYHPAWPGADLEDARREVELVLARLGATDDEVVVTEAKWRRIQWTQPTPAGPMRQGGSERSTEWTRTFLHRHYVMPDRVAVERDAAAHMAATFDACRLAVAGTPRTPDEATVADHASVMGGRLTYVVELRYGEGTPGGDTYHGCPPQRTTVHVDAQTGAILHWDDTHICM